MIRIVSDIHNGHFDPLLAAPDVLRFTSPRNTEDHRISPAENNKC